MSSLSRGHLLIYFGRSTEFRNSLKGAPFYNAFIGTWFLEPYDFVDVPVQWEVIVSGAGAVYDGSRSRETHLNRRTRYASRCARRIPAPFARYCIGLL